jgi:hypothetical protein
VFLEDRLVASYPVVLEANNPTDQDFVDHIRRYMRHYYSKEDIAAARLLCEVACWIRDPDLLRRHLVRGHLSRLCFLGQPSPKTC